MRREAQSSRFEVRGSQFQVPRAEPGLTLHSPLSTLHSSTGFTLLELLVVIAIIGILAALAVPTMNSFKPSVTATAERQLLDDLARARQLAISRRTTVAVLFVPSNFWSQVPFASLPPTEINRSSNLFDKQMIGYTLVSLRSIGDQPGQTTKRYLSPWKTLPEGTFIAPAKFGDFNELTPIPVLNLYTNGVSIPAFQVYGFHRTNNIPFPSEDAPAYSPTVQYVEAPYIAFDYMGRLTSGRDEIIPLAKGSAAFKRDPGTKQALPGVPSFTEMPVGNCSNSFSLVYVDWLTGRARVEHQPIQ